MPSKVERVDSLNSPPRWSASVRASACRPAPIGSPPQPRSKQALRPLASVRGGVVQTPMRTARAIMRQARIPGTLASSRSQ